MNANNTALTALAADGTNGRLLHCQQAGPRKPRRDCRGAQDGPETASAREKARAADEDDRRFALLVALMVPRERRRHPDRRARPLAHPEHGENAMNEQKRPVVTRANENRIRGGVTGHNARYVLMVSIAIVVVAFVAIYFFMRP